MLRDAGRAWVREALVPGGRFAPWEGALLAVVAVLTAVWTGIALHDTNTLDAGLAYQAGQVAWATGHPETLSSWDGTATLAAGMAAVSRLAGEGTTAAAITVLNGLLALTLCVVAWREVRRRAGAGAAAVVLGLAVVYAPAVSSIWWKQFNLIALAGGVAAFALVRQRRPGWAGLVLAISIAVKPLLVLVPLALLARRSTRAAGAWTVAALAALTAGAGLVLAERARDLRAANPLTAYTNFADKAAPLPNGWSCHAENFAPTSTLCRLAGPEDWTVQRAVILGFVALLALVAVDALRGRDPRSWAAFGFASALSPMVSPLAWSHYQVLLGPMFVVIACELALRRGRISHYATAAVAYLLCELVWRPEGTLPGLIHRLGGAPPEGTAGMFRVFGVAEFGQYVLFLAAVLVVGRGPAPTDGTAPVSAARRTRSAEAAGAEAVGAGAAPTVDRPATGVTTAVESRP